MLLVVLNDCVTRQTDGMLIKQLNKQEVTKIGLGGQLW